MNAASETVAPESSPQASLSSENIAGDAYLKIDFAEFGYVEYKRDDPVDRLPVLGVFEVSWFSVKGVRQRSKGSKGSNNSFVPLKREDARNQGLINRSKRLDPHRTP